jgi:hypothetical protein
LKDSPAQWGLSQGRSNTFACEAWFISPLEPDNRRRPVFGATDGRRAASLARPVKTSEILRTDVGALKAMSDKNADVGQCHSKPQDWTAEESPREA